MVRIMTECIEDYLKGRSNRLSKKNGIQEQLDLFIFSVGWESRCQEIIKYDKPNFKFNKAILLTTSFGNVPGYKSIFFDKIEKYAKRKTIDVTQIDIKFIEKYDNTTLQKSLENLTRIILETAEKQKRPINIGFEISSCPRRIILYLLAFCLNRDLFDKFIFYYSEGKYQDYNFSKGDWRLVEIPTITNVYNFSDKKFYIFSAGFEENRYRSIIANEDPYNIGLLIPTPGYSKEYTDKVNSTCTSIIRDFNIKKQNVAHCRAGDAIAAWSELKRDSLNQENYNISYLPFGPKPHVLAMGLHGFLNKNIHVLYRIPKGGYKEIEVESNGVVWRYEIKNLLVF